MKQRRPVIGARIRVGTVVQQPPDLLGIQPVGRDVKCRSTERPRVVEVCAFLQECGGHVHLTEGHRFNHRRTAARHARLEIDRLVLEQEDRNLRLLGVDGEDQCRAVVRAACVDLGTGR